LTHKANFGTLAELPPTSSAETPKGPNKQERRKAERRDQAMAGGIMSKLASKVKRTAATAGGELHPGRTAQAQSADGSRSEDDREENPMFVADFLVSSTCNSPNCQPGSVVNYIIKSANEAYA